MSDAKAKKAAEIQNSIRQVLCRDWDPIGCGVPEDEYDSYIGPIYPIRTASRSEQEVVEFHFRTERDTIGLACDSPEKLRPVAQKLFALDVTL